MKIKKVVGITVVVLVITTGIQKAMAVEEASYVLISKDKAFEIREYTPHVVAEKLWLKAICRMSVTRRL